MKYLNNISKFFVSIDLLIKCEKIIFFYQINVVNLFKNIIKIDIFIVEFKKNLFIIFYHLLRTCG